jgi:hypothetical protein
VNAIHQRSQNGRHLGARLRQIASRRISWVVLSLLAGASTVRATEYIYGIGTDWNLYQISVNGSTVTTTAKLSLSGYIPGFGTHNNDYINGLGIDQSTGDIYFNYSYNNQSSTTSGTMTVVPYIYQNVNGAYRAPYALGAAINSPTISATDVGAGWLPRATYYNGSYYAGLQQNDTMVVLPISGTTTKSYASITSYANWDHTSTTALNGGDFVIGNNNVIYGTTAINSGNTFYRQSLSSATDPANGTAWTTFNVDSSIPFATQGSIQVAGLGQSSNLYVISSTGKNLYSVNNYDGVSAPTFSQIGSNGVIPITMTDLSIVVTTPLPVPEASTTVGAAAAVLGVGGEWLRRHRRRRNQAPEVTISNA